MRTRTLTASLAAALAAVGSSGCGSEESQNRTARAAAAAIPESSVVLVEGVYPGKKTQVTGVVFEAKEGLVITANHAMENAPTINVRLANGRLTHARQVARAQCHDLAVLRLIPKPPGLSSMRLGDSARTSVGEPLTTMTYLLPETTGEPSFTRVQGTISALEVQEAFPPLPKTGPFIAHQTPLLAPASGSPVIDTRGQMVGLNTLVAHPRRTALEGVEYALTSNYIRTRLRELRPGVGGALGGWGDEHDACHTALHNLIGKGHTQPGAVPNSASGR
jgi:S1-C subfamily serine protease